MPIDIYRAKAKMFQIIDGKLMPSLASIEGMGDKAAEAVEEASKTVHISHWMISVRGQKVSKTVIDLMAEWDCWEILHKVITFFFLVFCGRWVRWRDIGATTL